MKPCKCPAKEREKNNPIGSNNILFKFVNAAEA